jgi:hypothetical protein
MAAISMDTTEMRNVAFECPICMTLATSGPIKQCKNGHHICDTCASRLDKCPSCKEKIDIRNLQLENLRDATPFPCQNVDNGCKVELKLKYLKNHQDQCQHGLLPCVLDGCKEKMPLKDLIFHLNIKHDYQQHTKSLTLPCSSAILFYHIKSNDICINDIKGDWIWNPWRLKYESKTIEYFFLQMSRKDVGIWIVWVYIAGYAPKAKEYWCSIKAFSKNDSKLSVEFRGDVIPLNVDRETVNEKKKALILSDELVHELKTQDGDLYFDVSIGKR